MGIVTMATSRNSGTLLEINDEIIKKQLLLEPSNGQNKELETLFPETLSTHRATAIKPIQGLCVKTRDSDKNKVFLNICTSDAIPAPEDITEEELIKILESDDVSNFRVPMSIGQPHSENDKAGESCDAYDVVISPEFFKKMNDSPLFHNFFMVATMEGIEQKYSLELDKNGWNVLKNKKYHGTMPTTAIRTTVPLVQELSDVRHWNASEAGAISVNPEDTSITAPKPLITEISTKTNTSGSKKPEKQTPKLVMHKVDNGTMLEADIDLPTMMNGKAIDISVGEDRLVVETPNHFLDVFLPLSLNNSQVSAHFITSSRILNVRVPISIH